MQGIVVNSKLDKDYILNDSINNKLKIEVDIESNSNIDESKKGVHFCFVLDVSGSMFVAIEKSNLDTNNDSKVFNIEGMTAYEVSAESNPATIDIAIRSLRKSIDKLTNNDKITLIKYNEEASVVFERCSKEDMPFIEAQLDSILNIQYSEINDKYTNISKSLDLANEVLSKYNNDNKKIIFITDGRPSFNKARNGKPIDKKSDCRTSVMDIADSRIAIDYFGLECVKYEIDEEELEFTFLEELSKQSNGNIYLVKDEESFDIYLSTTINMSKKSNISKARLKMQFSKGVVPGDIYMTQPQHRYIGEIKPNKNRVFVLDLYEIGNIKSYSFVFEMNVNSTNVIEDRMDLIKLVTNYTIEKDGDTVEYKTPVEKVDIGVGSDIEKAKFEKGTVVANYEKATIKKYQDQYIQAYKNKDRSEVITNIERIIDICEDQGEIELAKLNKGLLDKYIKEGLISQSDINKQSSSSTTMKSSVKLQTSPRQRSRKIKITGI